MRLGYSSLALGFAAITLTFGNVAAARTQAAGPATQAPASAEDQRAIEDFQHNIKAYLDIQKNAPPQARLKRTDDPKSIEQRREALKQFIRSARPTAKQGDIFTQPIDTVIRRQLRNALSGTDGAKLRRSLQNAEPIAAAQLKEISINGDYPNQEGQPLQSSPGTLLQHLPLLPKGLEYRMVGSTLVLRDTEANIVVDYLPNAIPQR